MAKSKPNRGVDIAEFLCDYMNTSGQGKFEDYLGRRLEWDVEECRCEWRITEQGDVKLDVEKHSAQGGDGGSTSALQYTVIIRLDGSANNDLAEALCKYMNDQKTSYKGTFEDCFLPSFGPVKWSKTRLHSKSPGELDLSIWTKGTVRKGTVRITKG